MSKALLTAFNDTLFLLPTPFYFPNASLTATAQATVAPTIGLLPIPIKPIISTCNLRLLVRLCCA